MTTPLITRLEEAAEGCPLLDRELWVALEFDGRSSPIDAPEYTTSIDAALALADRVLPEMNCVGFDKSPSGVEAYVSRNNVDSGHWFETGWHKSSPAIALCIAILKANHKDKP
jgi:hypothetical protein